MIEFDDTERTPRAHMTTAQLQQRYPRLISLMKFAAILSTGEATACLRDYRAGLTWSGEAVNHFGGTLPVLQAATRTRHNYSLLNSLGLSRQTNCKMCLLPKECSCPCLRCRTTRQLAGAY